MKLTTKSEYSILALIYIARNKDKALIKIADICEEYNIPKKYLEQLFLILKQNRIVKARRGSSGGYCLALPAKNISLAQIIRLMDGALAPTESVSKFFYSETPLAKEKKVLGVFKEIRSFIVKKVENTTIDDFI